MPKQAIVTDKAPKARSVYNQAIVANGFVFASGQIPQDVNGKIIEGSIQDRTVHQIDHQHRKIRSSLTLMPSTNASKISALFWMQLAQALKMLWK